MGIGGWAVVTVSVVGVTFSASSGAMFSTVDARPVGVTIADVLADRECCALIEKGMRLEQDLTARRGERFALLRYRKASSRGHPLATFHVGRVRLLSTDPDIFDPKSALASFKSAADARDAQAKYQLAAMWDPAPPADSFSGMARATHNADELRSMPGPVPRRAFALYEEAADLGVPEAALRAAQMRATGTGTIRDRKSALAITRRLAKTGMVQALADMVKYTHGTSAEYKWVQRLAEHSGRPEDALAAAEVFIAAARRMDEHAGANIASAVHWLRRAVPMPEACAQLAVLGVTEPRLSGIGMDEAFGYVKAAAASGDVDCLVILGRAAMHGAFGQEESLENACLYFHRAVELGDDEAMQLAASSSHALAMRLGPLDPEYHRHIADAKRVARRGTERGIPGCADVLAALSAC